MNKKLKRIIAWIALVLLVGSIAAFMCQLIDDTLLNGSIGYVALVLFGFAFALFVVIKLDDRAASVNEANRKMVEGERAEDEKRAEAEHGPDNSTAADAEGGIKKEGE